MGQGLRCGKRCQEAQGKFQKWLAAVECVRSSRSTVCHEPVPSGESVCAQSFPVPGVASILLVEKISSCICVEPSAVVPECFGHERSRSLSWSLFAAFCSRGQAGRLLGPGMGRSLRKTVGSWCRGNPSGSRLPLSTRALVLGTEGDHLCLPRLQSLGSFAPDAGYEGLQPLLLGLLKARGCRGSRSALGLLACRHLGRCLLFWLPRLSFLFGSLAAASSMPEASGVLTKEPWVGLMRATRCRRTT